MNLNDKKIVVAIENAVCEQLEASGIFADPFRLDGEKIVDVILEQIEGFVLVPKEPTEEMLSKAIRKYLEVSDLSVITNRMSHLYELIINEAMIEAAQGEGHE